MATINDYNSQFSYEDDDSLPDLFGDREAAMESIDEDDYDDDTDIELTDEDDIHPTIFEEGQFDQYAKYCELPETEEEESVEEPVKESTDDFTFGFDLFNDDFDIATEALDDDLDALGDMDGSNEEEDDTGEDTLVDDATEDEEPTDDTDNPEDDTPDDLAAATDEQLEEDNQSPDDEMNGEDLDEGSTDDTTDMSTTDPTADDPLKSVETKSSYRDKFIILYNALTDSLDAMEDFTPDFNSEASKLYYEIKRDINILKDSIYDICVKKMNKIPVDEVLRQYTTCNLAHDAIIRDMHKFSEIYNREMKASESKEKRRLKSFDKPKK